MANWTSLKEAVTSVIKSNGNQEITGAGLQNVLINIITNVGKYATFAGVASLTTDPGIPDGPIYYLAYTNGTYVNFGNIVLSDEIAILIYKDSVWHKLTIDAATKNDITNLQEVIGNIQQLNTENKSSLVEAINELAGGGGNDSAGLPGLSSSDGTTKVLLFDQNTTSYIPGLLEINGQITNGYNGHTSDYIEVTSGDILSVNAEAKNYDYSRPTILGFDNNKNVKVAIAKAIDYTGTGIVYKNPLYYEYYQVPSGVKYVRLSANTASFSFYKVPFINFIDELQKRDAENQGIYSPYDTTAFNNIGGARLNGDSFIPVYEGLTVFCSAIGYQNAKGLGLYDNTKTFVKSLPISYGRITGRDGYIFSYRFTHEDIAEGIAYMRADSFYPVVNATTSDKNKNLFFILNDFSTLTNADKIFLKNNYYSVNVFRAPTVGAIFKSVFSSSATIVSDTKITTLANTIAVVQLHPLSLEALPFYGDVAVLFVELEISNVSENCSVKIAGRKLGVYKGLEAVSNGTYYVPIFFQTDENSFIHVTVSNGGTATLEIKRAVTYYIPTSFVEIQAIGSDNVGNAFIEPKHTQTVDNSYLSVVDGWLIRNAQTIVERYYADNFMTNATNVTQFAKEAAKSIEMETHSVIKGKTYVSFGTSITQGTHGGYTPYIANFFGLQDKNLGVSSSVPHGANGSLREERLALIPADTVLCTICYGANGWVQTEDIDSRDITTSIGAINHAIDYIRENNPTCVIVLGLDYGGPLSRQCNDLKAIAERRGLLYAPTEYIDGDLAWNSTTRTYTWSRRAGITSYDGVHLNVLGNTRMASAFISTISKLLTPKGVN